MLKKQSLASKLGLSASSLIPLGSCPSVLGPSHWGSRKDEVVLVGLAAASMRRCAGVLWGVQLKLKHAYSAL